MSVSVKFSMDNPELILRRRGLDDGGRAQVALDNEVLRLSEPYVPFRTGMLVRSGIYGTDAGSGVVEYSAPYSKCQYYNGRTPRGSSLRGRYWFERMKVDHLDDLHRVVRKFSKE